MYCLITKTQTSPVQKYGMTHIYLYLIKMLAMQNKEEAYNYILKIKNNKENKTFIDKIIEPFDLSNVTYISYSKSEQNLKSFSYINRRELNHTKETITPLGNFKTDDSFQRRNYAYCAPTLVEANKIYIQAKKSIKNKKIDLFN